MRTRTSAHSSLSFAWVGLKQQCTGNTSTSCDFAAYGLRSTLVLALRRKPPDKAKTHKRKDTDSSQDDAQSQTGSEASSSASEQGNSEAEAAPVTDFQEGPQTPQPHEAILRGPAPAEVIEGENLPGEASLAEPQAEQLAPIMPDESIHYCKLGHKIEHQQGSLKAQMVTGLQEQWFQ